MTNRSQLIISSVTLPFLLVALMLTIQGSKVMGKVSEGQHRSISIPQVAGASSLVEGQKYTQTITQDGKTIVSTRELKDDVVFFVVNVYDDHGNLIKTKNWTQAYTGEF